MIYERGLIFPLEKRALSVIIVLVVLISILFFVLLRTGPFAPVKVSLTQVQYKSIQPSLFGIATVEARHNYKIGPIIAGRLKDLRIDIGDNVQAGQLLGAMDPVDLEEKILAQRAIIQKFISQQHDTQIRQKFAQQQVERYQQLTKINATSKELLAIKQQELDLATTALASMHQEFNKARADFNTLQAQRDNLNLIATASGVVTARYAEPGSTLVAGQTVVEIVDPNSIWMNTRFDQSSAIGLTAGLPAQINLRSRSGNTLAGQVLWVEPRADAITEEILAKVIFSQQPDSLPPLGELAEVTIQLAPLSRSLTIPNAAVHRINNQVVVWKVVNKKPQFVEIKLGRSSLEGDIQVLNGLSENDRIVLYSEKPLNAKNRLSIVENLVGATK
jgi:HlyD family secretion protein